MGLDMFAYTTRNQPDTLVDFDGGDTTELHYWRKHPDLHGWMEALYRFKGGAADCFNCVPVQLNSADLDRLEADLRGGHLQTITGFFFGESTGEELQDDLDFIAKARQAIAEGKTVVYDSLW